MRETPTIVKIGMMKEGLSTKLLARAARKAEI